MAEVLEGDGVGVALSDFGDTSLQVGLQRLPSLTETPGIAVRCAAAAQRHFSLEQGVAAYKGVYMSLPGSER